MSESDVTTIPQVRRVTYDTYANFPATNNAVGDLAYATDQYLLYRWNGTAWQVITSRNVYSELWSAVYEVTANATWENWDISGIVPVGTTSAEVLITGDTLTASPSVGVRVDGSALARYHSICRDGGNTGRHTIFCPVTATRIIECYESVITAGVVQFRIVGYSL